MISQKDKSRVEHLLKAARQYQENGNHRKAMETYKDIVTISPELPVPWFKLGLIMQEQNLLGEAIKPFCEAARRDGQYHGFLFSFGLSLVSKNLLDEAVIVMNFLLKLQPAVPEVHYSLGLIYFHKKQLAYAEQLFKKAIELKSDYSGAYKDLGRVLMESDRLSEARDSFKMAVRYDPACHEAFRFIGDISRDLGDYEKAVEAYLAEYHLQPDRIECLFDIGLTYLRQHDYKNAAEIFKIVIEKAPRISEAHYNLGLSYQKQKKYYLAIEAYKSVFEFDQDNASAHNDLGMIYDLLGMPEKAIQHYGEVVKIDPSNMVARHILAALTGEQLPNSHPDYVSALFDQYSESFEVDLVENLKYTVPAKLMDKVVESLNGVSQFDNVLDLGCGTGMCGEKFWPIATKITGVDLSEKMLSMAAKKKVYSSLTKQDIVRFLNSSNEFYDLFIAADVFIYVGALEAVFEAVLKRSMPQGYFAFSVESCTGDSYWLSTSGRYMHSKSYIQSLADKYSFAIEQCSPTGIRLENKTWIPGNLYVLKNIGSMVFHHMQPADFLSVH